MINDGVIANTAMQSPLAANSHIKPKAGFWKKRLVATVILTSLVDAFSILVIYLLVSFSNTGEVLYLSKDMELPAASEAIVLQRATLVKVEKEKLFVEDKEVPVSALVGTLIDIRKELAKTNETGEMALTIQADRRVPYKVLNQIVLASSQSGFSDIRFAVLKK